MTKCELCDGTGSYLDKELGRGGACKIAICDDCRPPAAKQPQWKRYNSLTTRLTPGLYWILSLETVEMAEVFEDQDDQYFHPGEDKGWNLRDQQWYRGPIQRSAKPPRGE